MSFAGEDPPGERASPDRRGVAFVALAVLAIARLAVHALFLPAYEGPDEPHHLGRIAAFADLPLPAALAGAPLDGSVIRAVELRPCGPGRHGCPPFGTSPGAFNLLNPFPGQPDARRVPNPENHQPPLYYLITGALFGLLTPLDSSGWLAAPDVRLLLARLLSVGFVGLGLFFPLRALLRRRPLCVAAAGLLFLLLPGACEALARCSNDAAVFLWSALLLYSLHCRKPLFWMCLLLAVGPLLKLTALPVAVFAVGALWWGGRRRAALLGALSSLLVFPVQASRGWLWGGTYEFNRAVPEIHETLASASLGFARSIYTIVKTVFWLGGWSFFRAPTLLVVAWFLLLAGFLVAARFRPDPAARWPHAIAAATALAGCAIFIVGNRRFYGDWGGVGGWYLWDWAPWILIACDDLVTIPAGARRVLLPATMGFVVAANVVYLETAFRFYL